MGSPVLRAGERGLGQWDEAYGAIKPGPGTDVVRVRHLSSGLEIFLFSWEKG